MSSDEWKTIPDNRSFGNGFLILTLIFELEMSGELQNEVDFLCFLIDNGRFMDGGHVFC